METLRGVAIRSQATNVSFVYMKYLGFLLLFLTCLANGSDTPVSGTFSNARSDALDGRFNLIVTATDKSQQFFLQCFKDNKPEFSMVTSFPRKRIEAVMNAGSNCPSRKLQVRLDYEEALINVMDKWVPIPRGDIFVPDVD
jgi:hypothetical protein